MKRVSISVWQSTLLKVIVLFQRRRRRTFLLEYMDKLDKYIFSISITRAKIMYITQHTIYEIEEGDLDCLWPFGCHWKIWRKASNLWPKSQTLNFCCCIPYPLALEFSQYSSYSLNCKRVGSLFYFFKLLLNNSTTSHFLNASTLHRLLKEQEKMVLQQFSKK